MIISLTEERVGGGVLVGCQSEATVPYMPYKKGAYQSIIQSDPHPRFDSEEQYERSSKRKSTFCISSLIKKGKLTAKLSFKEKKSNEIVPSVEVIGGVKVSP